MRGLPDVVPEGVKVAYLELFGQNSRLADACAATYPDIGILLRPRGRAARRGPRVIQRRLNVPSIGEAHATGARARRDDREPLDAFMHPPNLIYTFRRA